MLDLSSSAPELISRGEVEGRVSVVKQAPQDQSPCAQGLKAGQLVAQRLRTREWVHVYYSFTDPNLLPHIYCYFDLEES